MLSMRRLLARGRHGSRLMRKPVAVTVAAAAPAGKGGSGGIGGAGSSSFSKAERGEIRGALLDWYDHQHRVLPWRRTPYSKKVKSEGGDEGERSYDDRNGGGVADDDGRSQFAYSVWVSEMMLQQTQVATVKAYYERWMEAFPTIRDLAASDIEGVNKLWAGLGYYRRARFLLEGAKYVCENFDGRMPAEVDQLQKIPGIGE